MRATAALNVLLVEQVRPPLVPREVLGVTVAGYLDGWLERVRHDVRASTLVAYRNAVSHVVAGLGHVSLGSLAARQVQGWQRALLDERGLSSKTVANVHAVLHRALADAVRLELLDRNVASFVDPPRAQRRELTVWTVEELRCFLDASRQHRLYSALVLLATTGMRRSELLGLQWCDVDLEGRAVSIRRAVTVVEGRVEVGAPKTATSRRLVALDATTTVVLASRSAATAAGSVWVLPGERDGPLNPASYSASFDRLVARAGVPRIRVHDLRHTYATVALRAGVHPAVVSERLGHASVAITLDVYSHVVPGMRREAADEVAALLFADSASCAGGSGG